MKKLILLISFIVINFCAQASIWVVDSLNNSGYGTLRAAIDSASNGDTVRFNPSLIANGSDSVVLSSEIAFSKDLSIIGLYSGSDTLFLSGGGVTNIFDVDSVNYLKLDSMALVNGSSSGLASGIGLNIRTYSELSIQNCVFRNHKFGHFGGAVLSYADSCKIEINNSKFEKNKASRGGAIILAGTENGIQIANSIFKGNVSTFGGGGAITIDGNQMSRVEVKNTDFILNTSLYGGGMAVYSDSLEMEVLESSFTENKIDTLIGFHSIGGAGAYIYSNQYSNILIKGCEILGNEVYSDSIGFGAGMHFISNNVNNVNIENCLIKNNEIKQAELSEGGGLYFRRVSNLKILNSEISGNKVSGDSLGNGGAVYLQVPLGASEVPKVIFSRTTITNNYSSKNGGGVYFQVSDYLGHEMFIKMEASTFVGNKANQFGGLLCVEKGFHWPTKKINIDFVNSTLFGNEADSGGVVYAAVDTLQLDVSSSILALNGLSQIIGADTNIFTSQGYNMFSDSVVSFAISTDSLNQDSASLNLGPLDYNGGITPTMMPIVPSVAIDMGNPVDTSDAQNVPIVGIRDVGAAELCYTTYFTDTIIACDSYTWIDGLVYTSSDSTASVTITNSAGCDSIITMHLTLNYSTTFIDSITACNRYTWIDGQTYYQDNTTAQHTLINATGCDSVVTLNLAVSHTFIDTVVACDSYTWRNGITYTQTTFGALDTVLITGGCDSLFVLDLTIHQTEYSTDVRSVCDSLTWVNGVTYYSSTTTEYDTLINRNGCDSIVNLNLTISPSVHDTDHVTGCLFYTWSNGQIYFADNHTATQVFNAANGCDSILHLDLEIKYGTTATDTQVVCDSLVWIDGNTYYSNNTTAIHTLVGANSNGCDSIVTLNLTVNNTQTVDVITSCGAYTWIDGNTYTSNNNTATFTATNTQGCDSTVTLDLTVGTTTYGTESVIACSTYTWNGVTYTSNNTTALDTLTNALGCDSIVTLDLTILQPTATTDVISSCHPLTWIDGNTYIISNNTAVHTLQNSVGCDSVITLNFTLLQPTTATDVITSCSEVTWMDGNVYSVSTSGPTFTIPNAAGCDSVVTLDFTLLEVDTAVTRNYLTLTAQATNATYQWIDCVNGIIPQETNAAFTATQNGDYQVEVTQNGCVDTSACFSITNVGLQEASLIGVSLYPNPTSDVLNIDKGSNVSLEITVTNSAGAVMYNSSTQAQITTINMSKMASGVYVVTMRNENGISTERIVKR